MLEEVVELSAIAIIVNKSVWDTYYNNGISLWKEPMMSPKKVDDEAIQLEISNFWTHDWLFNPGYYIKLLATTVTYVEVARPDLNIMKLVEEKVVEFSGRNIDQEQELERLYNKFKNHN